MLSTSVTFEEYSNNRSSDYDGSRLLALTVSRVNPGTQCVAGSVAKTSGQSVCTGCPRAFETSDDSNTACICKAGMYDSSVLAMHKQGRVLIKKKRICVFFMNNILVY